MKKILLFLILHQVTQCIYSQPLFAPLGAKWYYINEDCAPNSNDYYYSNFTVTKDSIILGEHCTLLNSACPIVSSCLWEHYTYQAGEKVFVYDASINGFQTLFDFSLQTGESYYLKVCQDIWDTDSVKVYIDFADSDIDGQQDITITPLSPTWWISKSYIIVKGVGTTGFHPLMLAVECFTPGDPCYTTRLVCYETPETGIIHLTGEPCQAPNNTEEENANFQISAYPNPTTDYLNFELRTPQLLQKANFRIYDAKGRLVKEFTSDSPRDTFIVPVWEWAAGVYFLQFMDGGEVRAVEQFIVAKK